MRVGLVVMGVHIINKQTIHYVVVCIKELPIEISVQIKSPSSSS